MTPEERARGLVAALRQCGAVMLDEDERAIAAAIAAAVDEERAKRARVVALARRAIHRLHAERERDVWRKRFYEATGALIEIAAEVRPTPPSGASPSPIAPARLVEEVRARLGAAEATVGAAVDTFDDFARTLHLLGRPTLALAAEHARDGLRAMSGCRRG